METMMQGLVEKCGLDSEQAEKVFTYLKENASKVPEWLAESGAKDKIKDVLPESLGKFF